MTPREELLAAAAVIRARGWCQFAMEDASGAVCLLGAIGVVRTGAAALFDDIVPPALVQVVGTDGDDDIDAVITFNNVDCRSKRDAIAALEIAADLAA